VLRDDCARGANPAATRGAPARGPAPSSAPAIGSSARRMLVVVDVKKLVSGAEMALSQQFPP
jgi:hypothetical protein